MFIRPNEGALKMASFRLLLNEIANCFLLYPIVLILLMRLLSYSRMRSAFAMVFAHVEKYGLGQRDRNGNTHISYRVEHDNGIARDLSLPKIVEIVVRSLWLYCQSHWPLGQKWARLQMSFRSDHTKWLNNRSYGRRNLSENQLSSQSFCNFCKWPPAEQDRFESVVWFTAFYFSSRAPNYGPCCTFTGHSRRRLSSKKSTPTGWKLLQRARKLWTGLRNCMCDKFISSVSAF